MAAWRERRWASQASARRLRPERPKRWARTLGWRWPGKTLGPLNAGPVGPTAGLKGLDPAGPIAPGPGIAAPGRKPVWTTPTGAGSAVGGIPPTYAWPGAEEPIIGPGIAS